MAQYLEQCVESMAQSKYVDDLEVIIVNDGSIDNTRVVADGLSKKYPRSVFAIDKENGGHGSTINRGVSECCGKYFKVVDADDWVDADELDRLVEKLREADVDCVVSNFTEVYCEDKKECVIDMSANIPQGEIVLYEDYVKTHFLAMHSVTYKTDAYRSAKISLTEHCFYVDTEYIYYPLAAFKTMACYPFNVYRYRLQRAGQSVGRDGFLKHMEDHRTVMLNLCEFYENFPIDNRALKEFLAKEIKRHLTTQQSMLLHGDLTKEAWVKYRKFIMRIKKISPIVYKKMTPKRRILNNCGISAVKLAIKLFGEE